MQVKGITDDELIAALREYGSQNRAAKELGINRRTLQRRLPNLVRKGYSPAHNMRHHVPDGFEVRGVSSLYGRNGELVAQWVKSGQDQERQAALLRESLQAMAEDLPKLKPRRALGPYMRHLLVGYPIGDAHLGMLAWGEECGEDWDLTIAERITCGAMDALVQAAPPAETAYICDLGDSQHYDSLAAVTPRSGHNLDADGRYAKMIRVSVKVLRRCIESALARHRIVIVRIEPGNHNETGALWLAIALSHIYAKEPRVRIDTSPSLFGYLRFGKVLIGSHHGHTCKPKDLPGVMAADRAADWGETEFRYWWGGHVHHEQVIEFPGVRFESFNTLAAKDAYAANAGYRARRNMKAIVFHERHGEVARHTVHPAMLEAA